MSISLEMITQKMNEIKKEEPGLFYILSIFCKQAGNIDINGEAAKAIIQFFDFVPQQKELKAECYNELYNKLNQLLFKNSTSPKIDTFVRECDDYRKNFYSIKRLPMYYQCVKEFLVPKVADTDIKEAISEFIDANCEEEEEDKENIYLTLMHMVIDFNIRKISKEEFIKLLMSPIICQDNFSPKYAVGKDTHIKAQLITAHVAIPIEKCVPTDKTLYEHRTEPAVALMSEDEMIKERWELISDHRFIFEREDILSTLDSFLKELASNPKINWLKLKLSKMENALRNIDGSKGEMFLEQVGLIQKEIEEPKDLHALEKLDNFFNSLYIDLGGPAIDCPSYKSIAKIKARLKSDSISEIDLLAARENILVFKHYISPNKSAALETLVFSLEKFRKKHFEPKSYLRIKDCKPVSSQEEEEENSTVALGKKENGLEHPPSISKQKSTPVVHSGASSSFIGRRADSISMFSPRNSIKRNAVSSTSTISTHQKEYNSRKKDVKKSDLFIFRLT